MFRARTYRWTALALAIAAFPATAQSDKSAFLPEGSRQVGTNRYQAPGDFEATMRQYHNVYSEERYPRIPIIHQPGIRAVHIANPNPKPGTWEGLNIYEGDKGVRIYVVPAAKNDRKR